MPGLLLALFELVGIVPSANLKEASRQWPAVDLQDRVEHVESGLETPEGREKASGSPVRS
jgi:hypothetical protein